MNKWFESYVVVPTITVFKSLFNDFRFGISKIITFYLSNFVPPVLDSKLVTEICHTAVAVWVTYIGFDYTVSKNLFKINNEGTRLMLVKWKAKTCFYPTFKRLINVYSATFQWANQVLNCVIQPKKLGWIL